MALFKSVATIKNFDAKDAKISSIAGIKKIGINDTSIRAPIEIKNTEANRSLIGVVITLATFALFDSATSTPAKRAPVAYGQSMYSSFQAENKMGDIVIMDLPASVSCTSEFSRFPSKYVIY